MNAPTTARVHAPLPPGPGFWQSLAGYRRNPATYFTVLARRYGDVLRWRGPMDIYLLNDPDDVRRVMTQAWPQFTKDNIDYRVLRLTMGNGLVTNDGLDWARQRRLMQPMFHNRIVNAFDAAINACTETSRAGGRAAPTRPSRSIASSAGSPSRSSARRCSVPTSTRTPIRWRRCSR